LRFSDFYNWQVLERNEFIRGFCIAIRGISFFAKNVQIQKIPRMAKQSPRIKASAREPEPNTSRKLD
jgi:hypothetical protein